jgi:hypothetical protein
LAVLLLAALLFFLNLGDRLHTSVRGLVTDVFTEGRARVAYQGPVLKTAAHLRAILILFRFGFVFLRVAN